jgi:hypothetical protein
LSDIADVVDAAPYLESGGFVTGEILHVDGGQAAAVTDLALHPVRCLANHTMKSGL